MAKPKPKSKPTRRPAPSKAPERFPALASRPPQASDKEVPGLLATTVAMERLGRDVTAGMLAAWPINTSVAADAEVVVRNVMAFLNAAARADILAPQLGMTPHALRSEAKKRIHEAHKIVAGKLPDTLRIASAFALLDAMTEGADTAIRAALAGDHGGTGLQLALRHEAELRELASVWHVTKSGRRPVAGKYKLLSRLLATVSVMVSEDRAKKKHAEWRKRLVARNRQSAP